MKNCFLAVFLTLFACSLHAGGPAQKIREIAVMPGIKNASWGLSVKDAVTGKVLAEHDPRRSLVPASILT